MTIEITEEPAAALDEYARVATAFTVDEVLDVEAVAGGLGGLHLTARALASPYVKDYDADPAHRPRGLRRWTCRRGASWRRASPASASGARRSHGRRPGSRCCGTYE